MIFQFKSYLKNYIYIQFINIYNKILNFLHMIREI